MDMKILNEEIGIPMRYISRIRFISTSGAFKYVYWIADTAERHFQKKGGDI